MTHEPMTAAELDAIEQRCNAATPGEWVFVPGHTPSGEPIDRLVHVTDDDHELEPEIADILFGDNESQVAANWEFVFHARTDVPRLVAECRRLQAEVNAWVERSKIRSMT